MLKSRIRMLPTKNTKEQKNSFWRKKTPIPATNDKTSENLIFRENLDYWLGKKNQHNKPPYLTS